ncbi:glycosyltransferase family 2 protein [Selenomonas massiliensis]|uniref:glycosyltransferase family 2 protein n=1 Tax=Selenomonas massiliensis TaxID=2058293 RepID=UPI000D0EAEB4|nr:glycosyltransferase family 2 protein [Selenomonas massiliensis]
MQDKLVSVIMPAYNSATFIGGSISSVLDQTHTQWELIVVDDASTDMTAETVREYVHTDSRIKYYRQEYNMGVAEARNRAIRTAEGRYLAFLDSDDLWLPNKLKRQLEFMQCNGSGFTYTEYRQFYKDPAMPGKLIRTHDSVDYHELLKGNDIGCLTVMLDRKIFPHIEMPHVRHEDYVTWLNLLHQGGGRAYALHEDLARYRKSADSLTASKQQSLAWTWQVYRKTQGLSWLKSVYYLMFYAARGLHKHYRGM